MKNLLYGPFVGGRAGYGLLIFRVITGIALMVHGWPKIQNPLSWMPPEAGVPPIFQLAAALAEFGGGLALILGLLTPVACVFIAITMLVAIFMVHVPKGGAWIGGPGSYEAAASYLIASIMLFLTGPGKYSLDSKIFARTTAEPSYVKPTEKVGV